jgi:oligoribonuclease
VENNLVWIDMEMTGLDPDKDRILEIAVLVTDPELNVVAEGPNLAVFQPEEVLAGMDEWNRTHHGASGLLDRVRASTETVGQAEAKVLAFCAGHVPPKTSPLCGNSVWQDRRFLMRHMPALNDFFHYRIVDVSTVKELVKRWYPQLPPYQKAGCHLALADIRESVGELRHYRSQVFRN